MKVTGAGIVADLRALDVDPAAIALVRHGLGALADEIREIEALRADEDPVDDLLELAAKLTDPKAALR